MSHPTTETISLLEANGWTVESESPFEIRHDETGSFATMLAAESVVEGLLANLSDGDEDDVEGTPATKSQSELLEDQQEAFKQLVHLQEKATRYVATAQATATGTGDEASAEEHEAWETAYHLVFSDEMTHRITKVLRKLDSPMAYYDPNTTYQADVCAYVTAIEEHVANLRPFLMA